MWSTIANFKDNLSQIASDVLDTADELKRGGSQDGYDDELFDESHAASHRSSNSEKEADLKAEVSFRIILLLISASLDFPVRQMVCSSSSTSFANACIF